MSEWEAKKSQLLSPWTRPKPAKTNIRIEVFITNFAWRWVTLMCFNNKIMLLVGLFFLIFLKIILIIPYSVARWFWVKIPKIGHKPPDFITRFFLKKWKIPRFWAKTPSIFCVWNKVKLVYFSFVYHISFEINSTWQLLVAFWLLFTIFLLLWLLLVNLRCEFQKLKRRDKLMNLFANPPDPVLAIQDILRWQIHFLNWLVSVKFLMILKKFQKLLLGLPRDTT